MRRRQKGSELTPESWDQLLRFLGPDREAAGRKYEEIRVRLIRIFTCRGAADAEELADETINRVALKCGELLHGYAGDPALYFYGVARRVFLESVRRPPAPLPVPEPDPWEQKEVMDQCLEQCMGRLTPRNRRMILDYYRGEKTERIRRRRELARTLGIATRALRLRAHRIRNGLRRCVESCVELNGADETERGFRS